MIVEKINTYLNSEGKSLDEAILSDIANLAKWSFQRQFGAREDKSGTLRLSSIGRCIRQQAYTILNFDQAGKTIDARAKMVFFQGDMTELAIVALAKAAGCDVSATGDKQSSVEIDGVIGHPDGLLKDSGKTYLLEVKSMSSFSFKEFERGAIDDGYRFQCNAYMHALGLSQCVIVALNKDAGVLFEQMINIDPIIIKKILGRIDILKNVTKETLPERPYHPNDRGFYPWQCRYCAFYETCLPNAELVLVGSAYKLKESHHAATATPKDRIRTS